MSDHHAAGYLLKVLAADGVSVRRFHLAPGPHTVGSLKDLEVPLDETGVSRRHALLTVLQDGGVLIADLGSKNGTFVAGRRVGAIAVSGFAPVAFGSVQAVLQPMDAARGQVLLGPPGTAAAPVEAPVNEGLSTQGLHPLERLAGTLEEVLPSLAEGLLSSEEAAMELAHRWIEVLPVGRVELLRVLGPGREVVMAAASTVDRVPRATVPVEVEGPDGWKLCLRVPSSAEVSRLVPLFRLTLDLLAARSGIRRGTRFERPRKEPDEALPPPGLGVDMTKIYRSTGKVARGEVPVLILGESGAGKEVLARWVHARSRRSEGPFLAVNCAALPRELLEAELFGIEKGVATGVEARPGLLERGSGGTVFLDEVGDMAAETQAKVLRVLENTSLYRVGGRNPVQVDVRFVAATNRDLEVLVEEGSFRRDLYHRLAAFQVRLPPLRERREEIPALAARFFHRELEKNNLTSPGITRGALGALVQYPWPGNVRELQNEIAKAALLLEPGEPLDLHHLAERVRRPGGMAAAPSPLTLDETVLRAEREAFAVALAASQGDAVRAMELLGISKTTYYRKLKELGMGEERAG